MQLNGVPVLFIPGNGGSYKQARSSFFFITFDCYFIVEKSSFYID